MNAHTSPKPALDAVAEMRMTTAAMMIMNERRRQVTQFAHTADQDALTPPDHLIRQIEAYCQEVHELFYRPALVTVADLERVGKKSIVIGALAVAQVEKAARQLRDLQNLADENANGVAL